MNFHAVTISHPPAPVLALSTPARGRPWSVGPCPGLSCTGCVCCHHCPAGRSGEHGVSWVARRGVRVLALLLLASCPELLSSLACWPGFSARSSRHPPSTPGAGVGTQRVPGQGWGQGRGRPSVSPWGRGKPYGVGSPSPAHLCPHPMSLLPGQCRGEPVQGDCEGPHRPAESRAPAPRSGPHCPRAAD